MLIFLYLFHVFHFYLYSYHGYITPKATTKTPIYNRSPKRMGWIERLDWIVKNWWRVFMILFYIFMISSHIIWDNAYKTDLESRMTSMWHRWQFSTFLYIYSKGNFNWNEHWRKTNNNMSNMMFIFYLCLFFM